MAMPDTTKSGRNNNFRRNISKEAIPAQAGIAY
jgi:hypothetical protein